MTHAEFTTAGSRNGVALWQHECARFGVTYVSEIPSLAEDMHEVPFCGCRPIPGSLMATTEAIFAGS